MYLAFLSPDSYELEKSIFAPSVSFAYLCVRLQKLPYLLKGQELGQTWPSP